MVRRFFVLLVLAAIIAAGVLGGCGTTGVKFQSTAKKNEPASIDSVLINMKQYGSRSATDAAAFYAITKDADTRAQWVKIFKENPELLRFGYPGIGIWGGYGYPSGDFLYDYGNLYRGIVGNDSRHTLIVKIPEIGFVSPPLKPSQTTGIIWLPEGEHVIESYYATTGKLYLRHRQEVDARRGDNFYKERRLDWYTCFW